MKQFAPSFFINHSNTWQKIKIDNFIQIADGFQDAVNPFFVLLHDNEILRKHLAWVSEWMIMSTYSTWLLFTRNATSIDTYFKDVVVSIDSNFLVSVSQSQGWTIPSEEQVMSIYHVERSDLQIKNFASWSRKTGLAGISKVLNEKANNFLGKTMRVGLCDVRQTVFC